MRLTSKWLSLAILPVVAILFAPKASAWDTSVITQPAIIDQTMNPQPLFDETLTEPAVIDQSLVEPAVIDNSAVVLPMNSCGTVLTQPAVINSCGACGFGAVYPGSLSGYGGFFDLSGFGY